MDGKASFAALRGSAATGPLDRAAVISVLAMVAFNLLVAAQLLTGSAG